MRWMMLTLDPVKSFGMFLVMTGSGVAAGIVSIACAPTSPAWLTVTAETESASGTATAEVRQSTFQAGNEQRIATGVALETAQAETYEAIHAATATYLADNPPTATPIPGPLTRVRSKGVMFMCERLRMAFRQMKPLGNDSAYAHVGNIMTINSGYTEYFDGYDAKVALRKCG